VNDQLVRSEVTGAVAVVTLNRPHKRNALSRGVFSGLRSAFSSLPEGVRAVVLTAEGDHFCSGLDLDEYQRLPAFDSVLFSRAVHEVYQAIRYCGRPVVAAMRGATIGGGMELACAAHIRVAEQGTFYQLPEGQRGIFVGGGGSVWLTRTLGADRVIELMLTSRRLDAAEGERLGLSHYLVEEGQALSKALAIASMVAENASISNYMVLHAVDAIASMPPQAGLFTESLAQGMTLTSPEAREGIDAFLSHRRPGPSRR
jgi:enoyl-CoA hydratase/carnithine racemase